MKTGLTHLPDHSRLWMFSCERPLTEEEEKYVSEKLSAFTDDWTAHGAALSAGFEILYHRIIVLAVDEQANLASGCSIDKSTRLLADISTQLGVDFFNRLGMYFQTQNEWVKGDRSLLEITLERGEINAETEVLDTTLLSLNQLRQYWPLKLKDSWIAKKLSFN